MRTTTRAGVIRIVPVAVLWLIGCATQSAKETQSYAPPAFDPDIQAFTSEWQDYADEVNALPHQESCRPRMMRASGPIPRRGAVVMFHGFGGCPQQFLDLGRRVSAAGFDVLLPLLPGHGALQTPAGEDDLSRLPTATDWETRYAGLARRMNQIMRKTPGERVIVGFSLGGAVSLNAVLQDRRLYDRQLLLSPMFAIRGGAFVEGLTEFLGRIPGIKNIVVKPGARREECREWQAAGRAGFCDYRLKHVVALLKLEDQNDEMYRQSPFTLPAQIVAAGNEDYISNDKIVAFTEQQQINGPISLCFLPDNVRHEMLSPYENAGQTMYWLNGLLENSVAFITEKVFFPATENPDRARRPECDQSAA